MKKRTSSFLLTLSLLCLVVIVAIFAVGFIKKQPKVEKNPDRNSSILGEVVEYAPTSEVSEVGSSVQDTIQNKIIETKEVVSQKMVEVEKSVIKVIEKEVSNMTQSQMEALKLQICRDLEVITPEPEL